MIPRPTSALGYWLFAAGLYNLAWGA
ncbi:MAG: hypothetical protein RL325_1452, partial [Planctomycetota bacterium]